MWRSISLLRNWCGIFILLTFNWLNLSCQSLKNMPPRIDGAKIRNIPETTKCFVLNLIEGFLRLYNFNVRLQLKEFAYILKYVHSMLYKPRSLLGWTIIPLRGRSSLVHQQEWLWNESWELLVFWKNGILHAMNKFVLLRLHSLN